MRAGSLHSFTRIEQMSRSDRATASRSNCPCCIGHDEITLETHRLRIQIMHATGHPGNAASGPAPCNLYQAMVRERRLDDVGKLKPRVRAPDQAVPILGGAFQCVEKREHNKVRVSVQCQSFFRLENAAWLRSDERSHRITHLCHFWS